MGVRGSLRLVQDLWDIFLTRRVCVYTTESAVLARANGFDAGR